MGIACCKSDASEKRMDAVDEAPPQMDNSEFLNSQKGADANAVEEELAKQVDGNIDHKEIAAQGEVPTEPLEPEESAEEAREEMAAATVEPTMPAEEIQEPEPEEPEAEDEEVNAEPVEAVAAPSDAIMTDEQLRRKAEARQEEEAKAAEAKQAAEEARKKKAAEAKKRKDVEETKKKAVAEAKKKAEKEAKKKAEEEAKKKAEEEAKKKAEEEEQEKRAKLQKAKARKTVWKSIDKPKQNDMIQKLCKAAVAGDTSVLFQMLEENVDVDVFGPEGEYMTPLHCACNAGQAEFAKALIENGADPCGTIKIGANTPLHLAAKRNDAECCELVGLPKALTMKNGQGKTPKDLAEEAGAEAAMKALKKVAKKK